MPYEANVTDVAYRYDGSFAGFLCCVFESYVRHEIPSEICPPEEGQLNLFGAREILTDLQRAKRVVAGLDRLGPQVKDRIVTGFLSTDPGKDLTLLRFARRCFAQGSRAVQMLGDPDVAAAFAIERAVNNEACKLIEFIRFEEQDGMLGAVIHPKHQVLPPMRWAVPRTLHRRSPSSTRGKRIAMPCWICWQPVRSRCVLPTTTPRSTTS